MKVGFGIFGWEGQERRSNRYGAIHLADSPYDGPESVEVFHDTAALQNLLGRRVRITCKVVESRKSGHVGDAFLKILPSQPKVGEEIDLGVGILGLEKGYDDTPDILLRPGDGREELWMDPRKLYRLHDQTVDVFVEETSDDFTPMAEIGEAGKGAIDNGDGSYQLKTKAKTAAPIKIKPRIERLGEGLLTFHRPGSGAPGERYEIDDE